MKQRTFYFMGYLVYRGAAADCEPTPVTVCLPAFGLAQARDSAEDYLRGLRFEDLHLMWWARTNDGVKSTRLLGHPVERRLAEMALSLGCASSFHDWAELYHYWGGHEADQEESGDPDRVDDSPGPLAVVRHCAT